MKIREARVRTEYVIEYTFNDFWEIVANATNDATNVWCCFEKFGGTMSILGDVKDVFESFDPFDNHELDYIADKLGFDGWSNSGVYDERRNVRIISVYRNGDAL